MPIPRKLTAERITFRCLNCGRKKTILASVRSGSYCNRKCMSKHWRGPNHPCWRGGTRLWKNQGYRNTNWETQKEKALKRDGYQCQNKSCGWRPKEGEKACHVHHVIPYLNFSHWKQANRLSNLITLCKRCHKKTEYEVHGKQTMLFFGNDIPHRRLRKGKYLTVHGVLVSPNGVRYPFGNLSQFIRDHPHLFNEEDVVWRKTGRSPYCNASRGLATLFRKTQPAGRWKKWTLSEGKSLIQRSPKGTSPFQESGHPMTNSDELATNLQGILS